MLAIYLPMFLILFVLCFVWYCVNAIPYYGSSYYKEKKRLFLSLYFDKGAYGEYLIYHCLRQFEKDGAKFLFNCYLPTKEGETSEIDVMMIHKSGIYVFEGKNYSGWIFGSEKNAYWTQCLPQGRGRSSRKEKFYNPIMQNRTHVKWLKRQIGGREVIRNVIVFSERCTLKKLEVTSTDVAVVKRNVLLRVVKKMMGEGIALGEDRAREIYEKLLPFTRVGESVKDAHIDSITRKWSR